MKVRAGSDGEIPGNFHSASNHVNHCVSSTCRLMFSENIPMTTTEKQLE